MSYYVLARKWRPRSFQEMVGQEYILRMLINALDHQRLHHAYLFTGTRGVGKTTAARIFAKCLNCETGITSQPCGKCDTCQAIDAGKYIDLFEIDAASRTKVEDTRELLDNVQYTPTQGRYKIYLIDEVHMLSGHSFNALLKTLEEPPSYVIFLLATTDPKRLPATVLSRCLQFQLKRVPPEKISKHLAHICSAENFTFETEALALLADAADGSLRDALSLLDQAIAFCQNHITKAAILQMLGTLEKTVIYSLLEKLLNHQGKLLIEELNQLAELAPDFSKLLEDILSCLHQINLSQLIPEIKPANDYIQKLAIAATPEEIQLYYQIALIGRRDLPLAPSPYQGFEMVMLRMLAFAPAMNSDQPSHSLEGGNDTKKQADEQSKISKKPIKATENTIASPVENKNLTAKTENPATSLHPNLKWIDIIPKLGLTGMAAALAANCTLVTIQDSKIILALAATHAPMFNKKLAERIEQALIACFNKPIQLTIEMTNNDIYTPAKQLEQEQKIKNNNAVEAIQNDVQVKKIMDIFDAKLDPDSIKSLS